MKSPIRRILVHVDGTDASITAVEYALLLARHNAAALYAVDVVNMRALKDLVATRIFLESEESEYEQELKRDAERYLKHVQELAAKCDVRVETMEVSGSVYQEICRVVRDLDIDLLVLGEISHARSRRDEFYNESERAMRSVGCSVLIVKDAERVQKLFATEGNE